MVPANERLGTYHFSGFEIDFRLVVGHELALVYGLPKLGLEGHPLHHSLFQMGVEQGPDSPATLLCRVHRKVRLPEEVDRFHTSVGQCDSDADGHLEFTATERK